jgi:hypothetical protein
MASISTKLQTGAAPLAEPRCVSHPGVLAQLLAGLGGRQTMTREIRHLLFLDPALCLHTLRAVAGIHPNALLVDMGLEGTLEQLGTHTLKQLALGGAVAQLLAGGDKEGSLDPVWHQAVATALLSRDLAAAHRLLPGLSREPISPPADGVFLSQPLSRKHLGKCCITPKSTRKNSPRRSAPSP